MMRVNVWVVFVMVLWAVSACSSGSGGGDGTRAPDDANTGDGTAGDGTAGDGDDTGTGGGDGDGDGDGTAGGGTAGSDGSMELSCPDVGPPQFDPTELPECGIEDCSGARCLPNGLVTAEQVELLAACNDDEVCVPDELILTNGEVLLRECESVDGAEGRCVSTCVPLVAEQADVLPRDVCEDDELCAPCFDPITREATGACSQGCDPGPVDDPYFFPECCGGQSLCVPTELVPEAQRSLLGPDTCDGEGRICAPMDMAADRSAYPDRCESVGGAEGRCLPDCIPNVAAQADRLPRDVCDEGALCAPCTDPITAEDTGACAIGDDPGPEGTPLIFDTCCDAAGMDVGVCVPPSLVPSEQVALLGADTCGGGDLCAPRDVATSSYSPQSCTSLADGEGRCLPGCLPDVAAQLDRLPQDVCDDGYYCTPCTDPVTGLSTGACELEGDEPAEAPTTFDECCSDGDGGFLSVCVPTALVPSEQVSLLDADTCSGDGLLCAPRDIAAGTYAPTTCTGPGGAEARCLPACLPDVADRADQLVRDTCAQGELCVPCFDPFTGDTTGACELEDDEPAEDPLVFSTCCSDGGDPASDLGTCVPEALVPAEQLDLLGADTCDQSGGSTLCAPTDVATGSYAPQDCDSIAGAEGRCLPACLPDVASQADRLPQDVCDDGSLCAPCYDPITGEDTGSCALEGDAPVEEPFAFPGCCSDGGDPASDLGTCVPEALVPAEQLSLLGQDTCDQGGGSALCAPTDIASGTYAPTACTGPGGAEARCLPACLPDVQDRADQLEQDVCSQGQLCVPCYDPFTGETTGACELEGDTPSDPVYTFPTCCSDGGDPASDLGTCVPDALVPAEQLSLLGQDTCDQGSGSFLCAPTDVATGTYSPESCTGPGGAEARCLPACLPDVQDRAALLEQDTCTQGELCVPCFDPFTGESTGACELDSDTPAEPALIFDTCCDDGTGMNDLGTCVPESLVPGEQLSLLGQDTCDQGSGSFLCAPTDVATGDYVPESCTVPYGIEGRCLPACLPDIAAQADFLTQETCGQGELCAPCYDPFTGEDTGACRLEGDSPQAGASTFATCCDDGTGTTDLGTCVPSPLVPSEFSSLLGGDVCDQGPGETMCAPTDVATGTYTPEDCDSWGGAEGRCLAACLPPIADRADQLQPPDQDTCGQGELCAPCYDPITGESSGSCELEGDAPVEPAFTFPDCCSTEGSFRGRCVPSTAAGSAADSLPQTECEGMEPGQSDTSEVWVCAPNEQLTVPATPLVSCTTDCVAGGFECLGAALLGIQIGGQPGACLAACFLSEQDTTLGTADTVFGQSSCANGELCAPCIDPQTDQATGVCDPTPVAP